RTGHGFPGDFLANQFKDFDVAIHRRLKRRAPERLILTDIVEKNLHAFGMMLVHQLPGRGFSLSRGRGLFSVLGYKRAGANQRGRADCPRASAYQLEKITAVNLLFHCNNSSQVSSYVEMG